MSRVPESIERDLARVSGPLGAAVDQLRKGGLERVAQTVACYLEPQDVDEANGAFWVLMERLEPWERKAALGAIYDVGRVVAAAAEANEKPALRDSASTLIELVEQSSVVFGLPDRNPSELE